MSESDNYFENNEEITGFDDVNYVEGRWTQTTHQDIVGLVPNVFGLNADQLFLIKLGATWNDRIYPE